MLFEFKSRATGSVVMTGEVGKRVLPLIGKSASPTGIVTVDQMPAAITALEAAVKRENELAVAAQSEPKGTATAQDSAAAGQADAAQDDNPHVIGLSQRVYPLIEMMKAAHSAGKDITWGV